MSPFAIGISFAALTGLCWAILAIVLKYALQFSSTATIVWFRMIVAFGVLFAYQWIRRPTDVRTVFTTRPKLMALGGLLLACNYFGYLKGLELTSASNAQIMIQIGPLSLLFIGMAYFKEHLRALQWIGIGVASVGFVFFNWDQVLVSLHRWPVYLKGNFWILFAAITWALFASIQKRQMLHGWTPSMVNLLVYAVCAVALFPLAQLDEFARLSLWQWSVLIFLGLNTLIAYGSFAEAMSRVPAAYVSLVITLNPLVTLLLMEVIARFNLTFVAPEPLAWRGYLGALLVIVGVATAVSLRARVGSVD